MQFALTMVLPYAQRGYHLPFQSTRGTFGSGHPGVPGVPGVPGDPAEAVDTATVTQMVHHDREYPSALTLPVIT